MIGRQRLDHLQACVETVLDEGIPGDFIETGVWRGGACMLIKAVLEAHGAQTRVVWLADSFAGMPPPSPADDGRALTGNQYLTVPVEQVRRNFERFNLLDDRVRYLKGWFHETLPDAPVGKLALLRLDGDLYHSTMDALNHLYDRVVPGGFVIVDDYHHWTGCHRAVDEFLQRRNEHPRITTIDKDGVFWRKNQPLPSA